MSPAAPHPQQDREAPELSQGEVRWELKGVGPREIEADQRRRMVAVLPTALAKHGYDGAAVRAVVNRAGVSRKTFYELFDGKAGALRTAQREALGALCMLLEAECAEVGDWPRRVRAGVGAALEFCAADPARGRLIGADPFLVGPHVGYCHEQLIGCLAPRLRAGQETAPGALSDRLELGLIGGAASVVVGRLRQGRAEAVPELAPAITQFLLAPYLGAAAAGDAARGKALAASR